MAALPSLPSVLGELCKSPEGFIAYTGAGISIAAPSCAPNWWSLTQEIMKAFFAKCDKEWLPADFNTAGGVERQPEVMFENFGTMLGADFYEVFRCLDFGEPNDTHKVIALLAKAGVLKACYTTNFDIYIERALQEAGVEYDRLIDNREYDKYDPSTLFDKSKKAKFLLCKIHGTVDFPDSIVSTASVYRSSKGFAPPKSRILNYLLERVPCLYLGYSGWDYEHENYRKYWEGVGPRVKAIYWNKRPGETGGPKFGEIFSTLKTPITFCEADLPDGLVASIPLIPNGKINPAVTFSDAWDKLKEKRHVFFEQWASQLSRVRMQGLVMTDINLFTERLKKTSEAYKTDGDDQMDMGQMTDVMGNYTKSMTELAMKLSTQEITMEQYMVLQEDLSLEMTLANMPPKSRALAKDLIKKNAYPGITDNMVKKMSFITLIPSMMKKFSGDFNKAVEAFMFCQQKLDEVEHLPYEIRTFDDTIYNTIRAIMSDDESLWKPYLNQMLEVKEQALAKKITNEEFTDAIQKILKRANDASSGVEFDFNLMFQLQRSEVEKLFLEGDYEKATKALEGYVLTCLLIPHHHNHELYRSKELTNINFYEPKIPEASLKAFDDLLRHRQGSLCELAEKGANGKWTYARILLELLFLGQWVSITEHSRVPNFGKVEATDPRYTETTYTSKYGEYLVKAEIPELYEFLFTKNISRFLDIVWTTVPPHVLQKLCSGLVNLAERGNDFELCKKATLESLKASDGVVNQQTPTDIPISLASFCEARGDPETALHYYEIAIDAIKFSSPPVLADTLVYRAVLLTHQVKKDSRKAIRLLGKYHPQFTNNPSAIKLGSRKLALDLGEKLAQELGFPSLNVAVETLLNGKDDAPINQEEPKKEEPKKEEPKKEEPKKEEPKKEEPKKEEPKKEEPKKEEPQKEEPKKEEPKKEEPKKEEPKKEEPKKEEPKKEEPKKEEPKGEEKLYLPLEKTSEEEEELSGDKLIAKRITDELDEIKRDSAHEVKILSGELSAKVEEITREFVSNPAAATPLAKAKEEEEVSPSQTVKDMSGWMSKLRVQLMRKTFQKRYFLFNSSTHVLKWAKEEDDSERNQIQTAEILKVEAVSKNEYQRDFCFSILTKKKNYIIAADNEEEFKAWLQNLQNEVRLFKAKNQK